MNALFLLVVIGSIWIPKTLAQTCDVNVIPVYANIYTSAADMVSKLNTHIISDVRLCDPYTESTYDSKNVRFYDAGDEDYVVNFEYKCGSNQYTATSKNVVFGPHATTFDVVSSDLTDEEIFNALPVSNNKRSVPAGNAWWQSHVAKYSTKNGTDFEQHRAYTLYNFTKDGIAHEVPCADVIDPSECTAETLILPAIDYVLKKIDLRNHQNKIIYMPMLRLDGALTTYEVILPDGSIIKVDIDLDTTDQKIFKIHGHNRYTFHSGNTVSINHKFKLKFGSMTVHSYRHHLLARVNLHVSESVRSRRSEPKIDFTATARDPDLEEVKSTPIAPKISVLRSEATEEESEDSSSLGLVLLGTFLGILMVVLVVCGVYCGTRGSSSGPPYDPVNV